jgi:DNA-directed RNA polymerase subunit RPC12/RpoP
MTVPKGFQNLFTENSLRIASQVGVFQPVLFAFLLLLQSIGIVVITPDWTRAVSVWTALNVFSLVGIVRTGLLFGKKATTAKCIHCGSKNLVPATYLCLNCESSVGPPKQLKDKIGKD